MRDACHRIHAGNHIYFSTALLDIFRGFCILLCGKFYGKVPETGNKARSNRKTGKDYDKPCKR